MVYLFIGGMFEETIKREKRNVTRLLNEWLRLTFNQNSIFTIMKQKNIPNCQRHPCSYSVCCRHENLHCWWIGCFRFNSHFVCRRLWNRGLISKCNNSAAYLIQKFTSVRHYSPTDFNYTNKFHNSCEQRTFFQCWPPNELKIIYDFD